MTLSPEYIIFKRWSQKFKINLTKRHSKSHFLVLGTDLTIKTNKTCNLVLWRWLVGRYSRVWQPSAQNQKMSKPARWNSILDPFCHLVKIPTRRLSVTVWKALCTSQDYNGYTDGVPRSYGTNALLKIIRKKCPTNFKNVLETSY